MEPEPAFKKFKAHSGSTNIVNEFENDNTGYSAILEEESVKNVKDSSSENELNSDIVELLKPSVVTEDDELSCVPPQKVKSNSVDDERDCNITSEDKLPKLTGLSDLSGEKNNGTIQLQTSFNKNKSNITSPKESAFFNSNQKGKKRKKKRKKIEKTEYVAPNYFVAVQVSNPEIHKAVLNVQKTMLSSNEKISGSLINVSTLHITLFVLHISNEDELHVACSALDHCAAKLSKNLSEDPLCLKFSRVSHFSNKVVFAQLIEDNDYKKFLAATEEIREQFLDMGVLLTDDRGFNPHLTIAKLSKLAKTKENIHIRKIEPESYASERRKYFGEQYVTGLQLLSMNKPKDEKGYYYTEREALFDFVPRESTDHSECCFLDHSENPENSSKSDSSGLDNEAPSSSCIPNPSSITSTSGSNCIHRPELKDAVGNFSNMKDVSCDDKEENNYHHGQSLKPHTYICDQLLSEVYSFLFVEIFHHILDSFID
ncbi:A-kinase anchor protein 7 isoform gamma [Armadillidium vulgare]|nr:A-kinase anchor protein 7 isoform gamma [Armadillidium vulgare]